MRTKRKYAHELYPNPDEFEVQPLHEAVPYLYAVALGWEVWETGWFDLFPGDAEKGSVDYQARAIATTGRTMLLIHARQRALHADALLQGFDGAEAWEWAESRMDDEGGWIWDRAKHYGVPIALIKPYPCGPDRSFHRHFANMETRSGVIEHVPGPESECEECCEPDPVIAVDLFGAAREEPTVKRS